MNLGRFEMGDTGYEVPRAADGRSDRRYVLSLSARLPGATVYDLAAVFRIPRSTAFIIDDKVRSDADEEIDSFAAQGCANSACVNSAFAFGTERSALLQLKVKGL